MSGRQMNYRVLNAEEAWEKANPENKKLVKEYFEYLTATDKSAETKEKYMHNLKIFFKWVLEERDNKFFAEMTKRDYMGWLASLQEADLSSSRVKVLRSTVSSLSNFCETILSEEDERFKNYRNFILKIKLPTGENVREKTFLTPEQVELLLQKLEESEDYRGCLYVAISYYSAMRKAEVVQLKRSDFKEDRLINGLYKTAPIRGKGAGKQGKTRPFYIPKDKIEKYLELYLPTRKDDLDALFLVAGDKPATADSCGIWCKKYSRILGVPVYPHSFRASIATNLKEEGKDIARIQTLLGHNDVSTTMIYIKKNDEEDLKGLFD